MSDSDPTAASRGIIAAFTTTAVMVRAVMLLVGALRDGGRSTLLVLHE